MELYSNRKYEEELGEGSSGDQVYRLSTGETTVALVHVDGTIRLVSKEAEAVFKLTTSRLLGRVLEDMLLSSLEVEELNKFLAISVSGSESKSSLLRTKAGSIIWIDAHLLKPGSFACDFYGFASLRQNPVPSKTLDAIIGLDVFTSEYYSHLRSVAEYGEDRTYPSTTSNHVIDADRQFRISSLATATNNNTSSATAFAPSGHSHSNSHPVSVPSRGYVDWTGEYTPSEKSPNDNTVCLFQFDEDCEDDWKYGAGI